MAELGAVVAGADTAADAAAGAGSAGAGAGAGHESQLGSLRSEVAAAGDALLHLAAGLREPS